MPSVKSRPDIVDLTENELEEATQILAAAFYNDPLSNYVMADLGDDFPGCLHEFFRFTCQIRLELEWPFYGVTQDGQLQGVACLSLPGDAEWPPTLSEKLEHLRQRMGTLGSARLEKYSGIVEKYTTKEPHYFFGVLGVHPRAQGQGLSSLLINHAHDLSQADPASSGVALDTDTETNVSIYQHFGYRITAQEPLDDLTISCMFRPDGT